MKLFRTAAFRGMTALLVAGLMLATGGCTLEAMFQLSPSSEIPPQWKNDPRTKGWTGFHIWYSTYTDGTVVAHICADPYKQGPCFEVRGDDGPEPHAVVPMPDSFYRYGYFRFNGITERYEFLYPDPDPHVIGVTLRLMRDDEHTAVLPPVK
jgi:hypothetical protein